MRVYIETFITIYILIYLSIYGKYINTPNRAQTPSCSCQNPNFWWKYVSNVFFA